MGRIGNGIKERVVLEKLRKGETWKRFSGMWSSLGLEFMSKESGTLSLPLAIKYSCKHKVFSQVDGGIFLSLEFHFWLSLLDSDTSGHLVGMMPGCC